MHLHMKCQVTLGLWEGILPTETNPFPPQFLHNQQAGCFPSTIFNIPFSNLACSSFGISPATWSHYDSSFLLSTLLSATRWNPKSSNFVSYMKLSIPPLGGGSESAPCFSPNPSKSYDSYVWCLLGPPCQGPWGHKRKELPAAIPR